jgi:hypothetical protein
MWLLVRLYKALTPDRVTLSRAFPNSVPPGFCKGGRFMKKFSQFCTDRAAEAENDD